MRQFRIAIPFLIFLLLTVASCTKADSYSFSNVEGKIRGEWTIDKVALEDNDKLFETNVTAQFEGMKFNFQADNVLSIYDAQQDMTYPGVWYLDEIYTWDENDQEEDKSYSLYTYVYNPADTSESRTMTWNELKVNKSRLIGTEKAISDDGKRHKYTFRLKK